MTDHTADVLFSKFIRARDGYCQLEDADCWGPLQCAHVIPRRYRRVRWDPINAVALCAGHHQWVDTHPLAKTAWASERIGSVAFAELWNRAYSGARPDIEEVVQELRAKLKELRAA